MSNPALEALVLAVSICGGQAPFARAIGAEPQQVWNWLNRPGARVRAEYCPAIERATNRRVKCEQLRPDVDWAYLREQVKEEAGAN